MEWAHHCQVDLYLRNWRSGFWSLNRLSWQFFFLITRLNQSMVKDWIQIFRKKKKREVTNDLIQSLVRICLSQTGLPVELRLNFPSPKHSDHKSKTWSTGSTREQTLQLIKMEFFLIYPFPDQPIQQPGKNFTRKLTQTGQSRQDTTSVYGNAAPRCCCCCGRAVPSDKESDYYSSSVVRRIWWFPSAEVSDDDDGIVEINFFLRCSWTQSTQGPGIEYLNAHESNRKPNTELDAFPRCSDTFFFSRVLNLGIYLLHAIEKKTGGIGGMETETLTTLSSPDWIGLQWTVGKTFLRRDGCCR